MPLKTFSCGYFTIFKHGLRLRFGINFIFKCTGDNKKRTVFFFDSPSSESKKPKEETHTLTRARTRTLLVVGHVSGGGTELGVGLDDLVDGLQEVFLCGDLPASSDGEHAGLCAHAADLSAWQETHDIQILFQLIQQVIKWFV